MHTAIREIELDHHHSAAVPPEYIRSTASSKLDATGGAFLRSDNNTFCSFRDNDNEEDAWVQSIWAMYRGKWEYDVFLCFRGADTRHGFTSHLMAALSREKIKAFIDDMLDRTESIDELISVLQRSALSIVIFSVNFADSSWCLDEVATISQSMAEFGHQVLPVFYKVDPSDVSEHSGSYTAAIEQNHGGSRSPKDRKRWMDALKAVSNCAGHTSQAIKIESELVDAIVNDVWKTLVHMSRRVKSDNLIGMDARVSEVGQLLAMNKDEFRIIGLWGMGGVGKTTLAKACYQSFLSSGTQIKHHFVPNINEKLEKKSGIQGMVQELYSILLSEDNLNCQNLDISYRRERLSSSRVFLVLDSVETLSQLEQLLLGDVLNSTNLFAPGSIIILTTRNRRVLDYAGACVYEVKCLCRDESLQLFRIHAFRQPFPPEDWLKLSNDAVQYCKGSPLAIKVLGGALFRKDKSYWKSFLCELGKIPKPEIHDVLRRSYDVLETLQKGVFLDIACFFQSVPKSILIKYFSTSYIEDLIDKSLLIDLFHEDIDVEAIKVHDLLREMAWSIVSEESKLEKCSRLKNLDDIHKLLKVGKGRTSRRFNCLNILKVKEKHGSAFDGDRATEGICLNLSEVKDMRLEANAFEGMTCLRYLRFDSRNDYGPSKVHVPSAGLDTLPNSLRWLRWDEFPSKSLPSSFSAENLLVLSLRGSSTMERCWKVQPNLVNLVLLNLSHCINLVAIPDLWGSPNLEYLFLRGCINLVELPSHIQDLDKLVVLDLRDCTNLRSVPAKLNSKFLKYVRLSKCPKVTRCPEINSGDLEVLDLMETPVVLLSAAIYNIKQGGKLGLCGKHITNFPKISGSLKQFWLCHTTIKEMDCFDDDCDDRQGSLPRFARLDLVHNPQLRSLSRNIWKMVLQTLILQDCPAIETLPEISLPMTGLTQLRISGCRNLKNLPNGINNLKSLQLLYFKDTDIKSLPACILELDQLSLLDLSFNESLEFMPSNIHKLAKLSKLCLIGCSGIQSLPELPPNLLILYVSGCKSLKAFPSNICRLRWKELYCEDCPQLDTNLPREMVHNFLNHAISYRHCQGVLQYSGSEIPEWFACKSLNYKNDSCMMVQLPPPNSGTKRLIKGIAYGVVFSSDIWYVPMSITCDCSIETTVLTSRSSLYNFGFGAIRSDIVYIWYEKNLLVKTKERIRDEAEAWYESYAGLTGSFRFSIQPGKGADPEKLKSIKIKRMGISLLY